MSIYEVQVIPIDEADLPAAETLTQVFSSLGDAVCYASSLCRSTSFNDQEIIISTSNSYSLHEFKKIERMVRIHGK